MCGFTMRVGGFMVRKIYESHLHYGLILPSESSIIAEYVNENKGIVVDYALYNKLNISTQVSKRFKIYSNAITQRAKTIGNIYIERKSLEFTEEVCAVIELLEVLSNYYSIQDFKVL
jgi:hypothetical protein